MTRTSRRCPAFVTIAVSVMFHCSLGSGPALAQEQTEKEQSLLGKLGEDGGLFLEDAGSYFTAPLRFTVSDWLLTAGVAGGTVALMGIDEEMRELLGSENHGSTNGDFWDIPTAYGVVAYANIFSLSLYTGGLVAGSDDLRRTGRLLFESLTYSGITVMALRYTFGRSRPYPGNTPWEFNWFETDNEVQSFPSGHTTVAFAMSTVLAEEIGGIWARIGFYGMASMTAYARVRNNQHWVSDVVFGAGLGLLSGFHVVGRERAREQSLPEARLTIVPIIKGIRITYRLL